MSDNGVNNDKKQKLREKYYKRGGKKKAKQYYLDNKDIIKEKARTRYQNSSQEQKEAKREYSRRIYKQMVEALKLKKKFLKLFFSSKNNGCSRNKIW